MPFLPWIDGGTILRSNIATDVANMKKFVTSAGEQKHYKEIERMSYIVSLINKAEDIISDNEDLYSARYADFVRSQLTTAGKQFLICNHESSNKE